MKRSPSYPMFPRWVFDLLVRRWKKHILEKTTWCDEYDIHREMVRTEGEFTTEIIAQCLTDQVAWQDSAAQIVGTCKSGLGGKGFVPRSIWKAFCLAIEVFAWHLPSRDKLRYMLVEMSLHGMEASEMPQPLGFHGDSLSPLRRTGLERLVYSGNLFQACWLFETYNGPERELGLAMLCAMTQLETILKLPEADKQGSPPQTFMPDLAGALVWFDHLRLPLYKLCTWHDCAEKEPRYKPWRLALNRSHLTHDADWFCPALWMSWEDNLRFIKENWNIPVHYKTNMELSEIVTMENDKMEKAKKRLKPLEEEPSEESSEEESSEEESSGEELSEEETSEEEDPEHVLS
ncbi:hypothetical protein PG989_014161 [Apiospora arundinis]